MSLDHYVTLGRSGLRVSPLCLGAMTFGEDWSIGASVEESCRVLDRYRELGGNFIDTANGYSHGHSEKIIGDHLGRHASLRHQMVIATKFFASMRTGDPNAGGAGRKNIVWACDESLRRLQTDYIDLYWMHCWDHHTPIEETLRALDDLVSAGKVRHIGFSDTPAWKTAQAQMLAALHHWEPLIALQLEYSLLERTIEGEFFPMVREFGLGITPWSPLRSGLLSGKYRRDDHQNKSGRQAMGMNNVDERSLDIIEAVVAVAEEIGSTPARVALSWVCRQAEVTSPIIGARTLAQLEDNVQCLDLALGDEHLARLSDLTRPVLSFPHPFLAHSAGFRNGGTTINGEKGMLSPLALPVGKESY
ncbi:MAG: aldo/keto reductase [Porticoccaceae bacterium]